ncbi:MAG: signal peptidase I [Lachnospiraceae bacterium]|nr:signal peptidase I [Lachnospiraceae bacterium]
MEEKGNTSVRDERREAEAAPKGWEQEAADIAELDAEIRAEEDAEMRAELDAEIRAREDAEIKAELAAEAELSDEELEAAKEEYRRRQRKEIWANIRFFAISFVVIFAIFYVFPPYLVSGTSMNNTLSDKAFGFGIRFGELERGDIIVFSNDKTDGKDYIKRIIACPGDTIRLVNDEVYVNGELLEEDYAYYDPDSPFPYVTGYIPAEDGSGEMIPEYHLNEYTLGEDEYFVMGDNRHHSSDSRRIGCIRREDVKCRMLFFIWGKH